MRDLDAGLALEHFHGQVGLTAAAVRGVIELVGLALGQTDQFLEITCRHICMGQQQLVE